MSQIYLERHVPAANMARFYAVDVVPTLFGDWAVVREWGRIGSPGTVRAEWFGSEGAATAACALIAEHKRRRGYDTPKLILQTRASVHSTSGLGSPQLSVSC